ARHAALSPMMPQSIVESEELQYVLSMDNYDEEKAIQDAIELSLGREPKGGESRPGHAREYESTISSSSSNNQSSKSTGDRGGAKGKATAAGKRRSSQIGGNRGQKLIDPWLSVPASSPESDDGLSDEFRKADHSGNRQHTPGEHSRQGLFGRSRFDYEPMALMSTSATASGLRSDTPGPVFTSPRKQTTDVIEVNCSDHEDEQIECGEAWARQDRRSILADDGTDDTSNGTRNRVNTTCSSPSTSRSPVKKRLVRKSAKHHSVDVISSDDEEKPAQTSGRRVSRTIVDSSDEDELSRDNGKNVLKPEVRRVRQPCYPVAEDTIPQVFEIEGTPRPTSTLGSSAKMPWSIAEGPEQDIVLSTPVSKQRTLHYNMVYDSEDEPPESENSFEFSPSSKRRSHTQVHMRYLGLPDIESIGGAGGKDTPRIIDSEPESEIVLFGDTPEQDDGFATQPPMDGKSESEAEFQDMLMFRRRSRTSPTKESIHDRALTRLTKPRPLVLDLSDDDQSQSTGKGSKGNNAVDTEEEHRRLRKVLMFTDGNDEKEPSCTPEQPSQGNLDVEKERRSLKESPFATYPIFNTSGTNGEEEVENTDVKYYPLWRKRDRSEVQRESSTAIVGAEEDEEEEERLEDSRLRRRSAQSNLRSASKKMRMTETAPDISVMESALKAAANQARQQAGPKVPGPPARMETIDSFSTVSDSQPLISGTRFVNGRGGSQREEIEDFSDDLRSQRMPTVQERKARRYGGLQLVNRDQLSDGSKADEGKDLDRDNSEQRWRHKDSRQEPIWPEQDDDEEQDVGDISPTLSQSALDRCPICHKEIPVEDMIAHVDEELLASEMRDKEEMEKRDEAMALALEEIYQSQDLMLIPNPQSPTEANSTMKDQATRRLRQSHDVSLDTPTRKVSHLSLDSPSSVSRTRDLGYQREPSCVIFGESSGAKEGKATHRNTILHQEPIDLSDAESSSSQSAFHIQPGQVIDESGSLSDAFVSTREKGGPARKSSKHKTEPGRGTLSTPFTVDDEIVDNDLDDFLDMPAPASMLNRPFRTKSRGTGSKTATTTSPKRKTGTKKSNKPMVELDDSEGDMPEVVEVKRGKGGKRGAKSKSGVLDSVLPEPARQRRQQMLGKNREQRKSAKVGQYDGHDDEIEIGRRHPEAEKLWNQEDDLLDSEHLDRRLVKGVGLGGIVGGIGAVPGSLSVSKVTKSSVVKSGSAAGPASTSIANPTAKATCNMPEPVLVDEAERTPPPKHKSSVDDRIRLGSPSFDQYEDHNYGLHSQEWWEPARSGVDDNPDEAGAAADDDGYMSPLDDFVDLRKGRDDPALAMYFAQFGDSATAGSSRGEGKSGRGRGRGRARGGGSGVSYGPGIGPMSTSTGSTGEQATLTVYGIPRRGAASRSSEGPATTANGSMAVRSKPTQPFVPSRGRGRGGKSNWRGRYGWAGRARGRGRGRKSS
ncbi:hypothetical protein BGX31_010183, partial [Mortierella sp. GBA43]